MEGKDEREWKMQPGGQPGEGAEGARREKGEGWKRGGCLKLRFRLDKDGNPLSCSQYVQREANQVTGVGGNGSRGGSSKGYEGKMRENVGKMQPQCVQREANQVRGVRGGWERQSEQEGVQGEDERTGGRCSQYVHREAKQVRGAGGKLCPSHLVPLMPCMLHALHV